jgi:hypothetical protein
MECTCNSFLFGIELIKGLHGLGGLLGNQLDVMVLKGYRSESETSIKPA